MFGPKWLAAPVTAYKAFARNVYLPKLASGQVRLEQLSAV